MPDKQLKCIRCGVLTYKWISSKYPECERCNLRKINLWKMDEDFKVIMGGC